MEFTINNSSALNIFNSIKSKSKSQFGQDLFVLFQHEFKSDGYFVEFGATNGFDLSNSYLLEKYFNWQGILAEPAHIWHKDLINNRSCKIDLRCVWKESGVSINFNQSNNPDLSSVVGFGKNDFNADERGVGTIYPVLSISLADLLIHHKAPKVIDYLSVDTEGSEFEILSNFDFDAYDIKIISCEHNFTSMREKIYDLLVRYGYKRVHEDISTVDDWYVKR